MFSKKNQSGRIRSGAATLAGVFSFVAAPASTVDRAPLDDRPGIANNATVTPWGEYLSEERSTRPGSRPIWMATPRRSSPRTGYCENR